MTDITSILRAYHKQNTLLQYPESNQTVKEPDPTTNPIVIISIYELQSPQLKTVYSSLYL